MASSTDPAFQYDQEVERLFADLVEQCDAFDPDELEAETSAGVVKFTFADGSRCIMNRQAAAQQVWLAEGASAWHFAFDRAQRKWLDTKGRGDLRTILGSIVTARLGRSVRFEPRS